MPSPTRNKTSPMLLPFIPFADVVADEDGTFV
jgi:hypothetical protein